MKSYSLFNEINWVSTYQSSDQMWLNDSLNWEKTSNLITMDWTLPSFVTQSSFVNQHILLDSVIKFSHLDTLLIHANSINIVPETLYLSVMNDLFLQTTTCFLPITSLFQYEYQETLSVTFLLAPELLILFHDYILTYYFNNIISESVVTVFDSYTNNLNYFPGEGIIHFMLFIIYIWFIVYAFLTILLTKWSNPIGFHFMRFYYNLYSISRETRIQFEVILQTMLFFLLYWIIVLLTFDDDQEEAIEFIDTSFFYFFSTVIFYLLYKYSVHYFAFLAASVAEGRSVSFIAQQFKKDFLDTFSLMLRFYILLFRMNVYDTLEDFFDGYYIFVGDFDDDEYLNELFLSLHGTLLFTIDNQDDRSFLLEDENDFSNDFFYTYYVLWGKLFFFVFFMAEEGARLALAFYITFLIIFEIHAVNCSYKEDTYFTTKKTN